MTPNPSPPTSPSHRGGLRHFRGGRMTCPDCHDHHESPDDCEAAGAQLILGRRDDRH